MILLSWLSMIVFPAILQSPARAGEFLTYAVCYNENPDFEALSKFSLVVLDPNTKADINKLKKKGVMVLSYLSVGEINSAVASFEKVSKKGILLSENPSWPGSYYVDIDSPAWSRFILNDAIPKIMKKGFDGLFLDTLSSPIDIAEKNPAVIANPEETVYRFLRKIRSKYPDIYIIANNFEDHSAVAAPCVDAFNVESVYLSYDFKNKNYVPAEEGATSARLEKLKGIASRYGLDIFVIDYAPEGSTEIALNAYGKLRKDGFTPFISNIELDKIYDFMSAQAQKDYEVEIQKEKTRQAKTEAEKEKIATAKKIQELKKKELKKEEENN